MKLNQLPSIKQRSKTVYQNLSDNHQWSSILVMKLFRKRNSLKISKPITNIIGKLRPYFEFILKLNKKDLKTKNMLISSLRKQMIQQKNTEFNFWTNSTSSTAKRITTISKTLAPSKMLIKLWKDKCWKKHFKTLNRDLLSKKS